MRINADPHPADLHPLLSHPLSSNPPARRLVSQQLVPQQDVSIVPRILCNQNGQPSQWKKYVYKVVIADDCIGLLYYCCKVKSIPKCLFLWSIVLAAHIARTVFCVNMFFPFYTCDMDPSCSTKGVCSIADFFVYLIFAVPFNVLLLMLIILFPRILLETIKPTKEDYKNYILSVIQPLLNENKLELAYKQLFLSDKYQKQGATIDRTIRSDLCKIFTVKLLDINFFEIDILDRLMLSTATLRDSNTLDDCFIMRVKKMHTTNPRAKSILTIISGIKDKIKRSELLKKHAIVHLTIAKNIPNIIMTSTPLIKEIANLVMDYVGDASLELAKMSLDLPLQEHSQQEPSQPILENLNPLQELVNLLLPIVDAQSDSRLASLRELAKFSQYPIRYVGCVDTFIPKCDPVVLSALQNLDSIPDLFP